jgi:hypothetical protein
VYSFQLHAAVCNHREHQAPFVRGADPVSRCVCGRRCQKEAGISLSSKVSDTRQTVLIDSSGTRQADSSAKHIVEWIASSSSVFQVVVRNLNSYADAMNAEASLGTAIAEANLRSQQSSFSCSLEPFNVRIELEEAPIVH